ncbi:hypothetical protein ACE6H2_006073 [Prunus campanulata]
MSREGKVVCVTGASGFIASWLVKLLLQRGYIVKATAELIDPAVKGTLNVLKSCVKFATVKRVVLTSSTAAVIVNGRPLTPDVVVDETWFSDPLVCENLKQWYVLSKTLAEEAAWKFAEGNGIDLVTINPPYVIGPLLQPSLNLTVEVILNLKNGTLQQLYEEANPSEPTYQVSQEKAKSLGVNFLPLEVSLRDTVESLKEKGFLKV